MKFWLADWIASFATDLVAGNKVDFAVAEDGISPLDHPANWLATSGLEKPAKLMMQNLPPGI